MAFFLIWTPQEIGDDVVNNICFMCSIRALMAEIPKAERYELALKRWQDAKCSLSARRVAKMYGLNHVTLSNRIQGEMPKKDANQAMQGLLPAEEDSLQDWVLQLESWGHLPRIDQLRGMVSEILQARGDKEELGQHWYSAFLKQHPALKKRFIYRLEKERALAENPVVISKWFDLYNSFKTLCNVHDSDVYNMVEKGVLIDDIGKTKVMCLSKEQKAYR